MLSYLSNAGVVKLADTLDLGSSASRVQVQVLSPAPMEQTTSDVRFEVFCATGSRYNSTMYRHG